MRSGQILGGRYHLEQRIAAGGMGEVWRATDTELKRGVAVKVLHPALSGDADFRKRFLQEARTVAALNRPEIVNVYDIREESCESGIVSYLVMEFVAGRALSEIISERGPLPAGDVMWLVAQIARGLHAAHQAGIIHRDIKPANILVNDSGAATIIDFGIARRHGQEGLTAAGSVMGTVEYASPEQLQDHVLTGASDVYSLGVLAYECLAGRKPFEGGSAGAIITGHLSAAPPPLPAQVPKTVAAVVTRALAKDPAHRFESAAQLAQACDGAAKAPTPPPVKTRPMATAVPVVPATPTRTDLPVVSERPRRRGRTLAGLAVLLVLIAGVTYYFWPATDSDAAGNAGEDPSPTGSTSQSTEPSGPVPQSSVMVAGSNGLCLLLAKADGSAEAVDAHMGLCKDSRFEVYDFTAVGDVATITFTGNYGGTDTVNCLGATSPADGVVADPDCDPGIAWRFTYLRTKDNVDYWQIRSAVNEDYCLHAGGAETDPVRVEPCDESSAQEWRTDAAQ